MKNLKLSLAVFGFGVFAALLILTVFISWEVFTITLPRAGVGGVHWMALVGLWALLAVAARGWGVLLRAWQRERAADKSIRTNPTLDRLYRRYGGPWLRRPDGTPWHGLKLFTVAEVRLILISAGHPDYELVKFCEDYPEVAAAIIAGAHAGHRLKRIVAAAFSAMLENYEAAFFDFDEVAAAAAHQAIALYTPAHE